MSEFDWLISVLGILFYWQVKNALGKLDVWSKGIESRLDELEARLARSNRNTSSPLDQPTDEEDDGYR